MGTRQPNRTAAALPTVPLLLMIAIALGWTWSVVASRSSSSAGAACCSGEGAVEGAGMGTGVHLESCTLATATNVPWLLDTTGFPARWNCGTWAEALGWLHIISDVAIWGAYMAIPVVLAFFILKRPTPLPLVSWLFIAFIASCGVGHLIEAIIFWQPVYRLAGVWKSVTATVSWLTVLALIPIVPKVLRWPTLSEVNGRLETEIEERKRTETQIRRLNGSLADKNRELEQFVHTASHDLKSPLLTIQGFVGLLQREIDAGRTERLSEFAARISQGTRQMAANIDDLLELSRIGRVTGEIITIDSEAVVLEVLESAALLIRTSDVEIEVQPDMPTVTCDPQRLKQVLENLLTNAIKHGRCADGPSRIVVGGSESADEVRLYVADNGGGVPAEYRETIFGLFERLDTQVEGTGVGLAIVRKVTEVHGGKAWVEDTTGGGATFVISLPHQASSNEQAA